MASNSLYDRMAEKLKIKNASSPAVSSNNTSTSSLYNTMASRLGIATKDEPGEKKKNLVDDLRESTTKAQERKKARQDTRKKAYETRLGILQEREDFDILAEKGAAKADNWFGLGNQVQRSINNTEAMNEYLRSTGVPNKFINRGYNQNPYEYMTPQQLSTYNAFIGLGDRAGARMYLQSIENEINQKAVEKATLLNNAKNIKKADAAIMAADAGAQRAFTGAKQLGESDAISPSYQEMLFENVRPQMDKSTGVVADVANSIGFMLPAVAVSSLAGGAGFTGAGAKALSAALFGAASGGSAYNDVLRSNPDVDKFDAKVYSIVNGALEGGLQYTLGGIGKLGGKIGLTKLAGKAGLNAVVAKKLMNVSKAAANTPAVQRLVKAMVAAGQYGSGMADEAVEEWLQSVFDPLIRNYVLDENNEFQLFGEEQLYSAMLGALGAAVMNVPDTVSNYRGANETLNKAIIKNVIKDAKAKKGNTSSQNIPELTEEELAAYGNDPDIAELATEIARLEEELPNRKKHQQDKAQKHINDLKKKLADLVEKKRGQEQAAPEEGNIPLPPPAPVEENAEAAPTDYGSLRNYNPQRGRVSPAGSAGADLFTRGVGVARPNTPGGDLINAGVKRGVPGGMSDEDIESIIRDLHDSNPANAQAQGQPSTRGMRPGDARRQNVQQGRAQQQARRQAVETFRNDVAEGISYRRGMDPEEYDQFIRNAEANFRVRARQAGMSEEEIEAEVAAQRATLPKRAVKKTPDQYEDMPPMPVEEEQVARESINKTSEEEQRLAELESQQQQLLEQFEQQNERIRQQNEQIAKLTGQSVPEATEAVTETEESFEDEKYTSAELVEKYRSDMKEARTMYRKNMSADNYEQYIYNLTNSFRNDAEEAGMSSKDIEKEIARQGGPAKVMRESGLVTDEDIEALQQELADEEERVPQPKKPRKPNKTNNKEIKRLPEETKQPAETSPENLLPEEELARTEELRFSFDDIVSRVLERAVGEYDEQANGGMSVDESIKAQFDTLEKRLVDELIKLGPVPDLAKEIAAQWRLNWDETAKIMLNKGAPVFEPINNKQDKGRRRLEDLRNGAELKDTLYDIEDYINYYDTGVDAALFGAVYYPADENTSIKEDVENTLDWMEGLFVMDMVAKLGYDIDDAEKLAEWQRAQWGEKAAALLDNFDVAQEMFGKYDEAFRRMTNEGQVTIERLDELEDEEEGPQPAEIDTEEKADIGDIINALDNDELTADEAYDEITDTLNQRDMEREAAGETDQLDEHTQKKAGPEVNVTEGRIEVKFPKWPGKNVTKQLKDAGFSWDKYAKIWWGGDNNTNRAMIEKLTGVKLTEDEFKPNTKRIPKNNKKDDGETRFSINNGKATLTEDANVDNIVDDVIRRMQEKGIVKGFGRYAMPEGREGVQSGRDIGINEELTGTTRSANAATHELGHLAARSDSGLVPDIIASMRRQGIDIDSRVEERRATYGEEGLTPPEGVSEQEYLEEEVAMEFLGGIGEENPELLNKITAENPGLIRRFINTLKSLWGRLTGNQRLECVTCINRLNSALARVGQEEKIDNTERYSVKNKPTVPSSTFIPNKSGETPVENMIPEVRDIWENLPDSVKKHITKHLDDINGEAWKNIMKKGGVDSVSGTLLKAKNWTAPQLEMAVEVGKYFADHGETQRAADIFAKVAGQQTDFGRAIKYLQTLQMYMPKSAAAVTHSIANDLGVELTEEEQANINLCDRIIEQGFISNSVMKEATGDFKEWLNDAREYVDNGLLDATTAAYAAAMTVVTAKTPSTARQKFRALQRISLLSNPKTHFRNILGNLAEQTGAIMSRPVADMVDRALSKVTGKRTFGSGGLSAVASSFASSIDQVVMDAKLNTNTIDNKFDEGDINSGLRGLVRQKTFNEHTNSEIRNTLNRAANGVDKAISLGLEMGDAPYLISSYDAALAQVMNANPELLVDGEATDEMKEMAWDVSQRRTFRDRNDVVKSLNKIRDALGVGGDTIAPYVTTPVNVVLTAIQYSPIAFGEAFCKALIGDNSLNAKLKRGENIMKTQRQIAELVGRGALGTALMLVGSLLRAAGKITGDDDDIDSQKEKNWNKAVGRMGSSIKVGDTYIDPSSLQSLSTPIMAGAAAYESRNDDEDGTDWGGIFGAAAKASMKMGNTMLEMPVLQGVADLLGGNYDDGELLSGALSLAGNAATQLVPFGSLLKQGAKAVDPYSRVQSEINAGPVERVAKSTVNNLRSMTPWGRKKLSERYDVLGNPIKNDASDNTAERLYNSFINPFNTSKENANDVTDEIDRLYASLQDTAVLPSAAGNSISYGGEKYKFTSADKQEYQRVEGETNAEILSKLVNSDAYDRLSDEEKAKVLSSVYDYSANKAKANYLKKQGVDYESDAKWMDSIDEIVKTGVDVGDAMVYRFELNNIKGSDDQVFYIDSLPLNSNQKDTIDEAFVDKYRSSYIDEDRDYTNADTLALSMTSDSGREKYNNRFSHSWRGSSGNYYDAMTGEEFGHFYDAYQEGSKADEKVAAIKKMLMEMYGYDESYAYTYAYDFRKYYAAKYD